MSRYRKAYKEVPALYDRHPYFTARDRFVAGEITREHAAWLASTDPEFIAECELSYREPYNAALAITFGAWAAEAVAHRIAQRGGA